MHDTLYAHSQSMTVTAQIRKGDDFHAAIDVLIPHHP